MRRSGIPHSLHIVPVIVPGVGKRFALADENGKRTKMLYKTVRAAMAGRYWKEVNSLTYN